MTNHANTNSDPQVTQGADDKADKPRAIDLLQKIKASQTNPLSINRSDRLLIVEMLLFDSATVPEMAQILNVSERTIKRDKQAIRQSNAITRDPKLIDEMVGRLFSEADTAVQRIRRAIRDSRAMPSTKVDAEHRCYQIYSDAFRHLQRIGFVPTAPQEIRGDLTHRFAEPPEREEIEQELARIEQIGLSPGIVNPQITTRINQMRDRVTRFVLGEQLEQLSDACATNIDEENEITDNKDKET